MGSKSRGAMFARVFLFSLFAVGTAQAQTPVAVPPLGYAQPVGDDERGPPPGLAAGHRNNRAPLTPQELAQLNGLLAKKASSLLGEREYRDDPQASARRPCAYGYRPVQSVPDKETGRTFVRCTPVRRGP